MTKAKKAELGKRLDRLENKGDAIIKALEELTKILVERQPLILSLVCGHPGCDLVPRMEAWHARAGDVRRLGDWAMPLLLGDALAQVCEVSPKLTMDFRDETTMRRNAVYALIGGMPLDRGRQYKLWINPCDCSRAFVADLQGRFLGVAPVAQAGTPDDIEAMHEALGVRQQALTAEIKALRPVAARRLREVASDAQVNAMEILGYDPAAAAAHVAADAPARLDEIEPERRAETFWTDDDGESATFLDEITQGARR